MTALHHRVTEQPNLQRFIGISFGVHIVMLIVLSITLSNSIRVSPPAAMQVKLVGVPQPSVASKPMVEPEKVRTQDSAAPKEPPPEMKNIPPSEAKTKFLTEVKPVTPDTPNPIEAKQRPPVLDKTPREKKVVKNDLNAKVVKNPEDFLAALDFVDKLEKATPSSTTPAPPQPDKTAGEGPQLQLNLADSGVVSAIRAKVEQNWFIPPGKDTRGLSVTVAVSMAADGNLTSIRVTQSSGDGAFDSSLVRAIRKAVPLPIPHDKYDTFRELELSFAQPQ